jgi:uncharacterized protein (DUF1800 family)
MSKHDILVSDSVNINDENQCLILAKLEPDSRPELEIVQNKSGLRSKRKSVDKIAVGLGALSLAACGGGGGGSSGSGSSSAAPVAFVRETPQAMSRFLSQATFGVTPERVTDGINLGFSAWLDRQFNTSPKDKHWDYVKRGGPINCTTCDSKYINAVMESFWDQAITGPDQLRQRLVFALTQIFVISTVNSPLDSDPRAHAAYLDMLGQNAFGNFRSLLEEVALSPAMGHYLSHHQNEKEDQATGRIPDENFAREVMQLFTIGLWELNSDGTRRKDLGGKDIPTYTQDDISGMAKVFTGWSWGGPDAEDHRWHGWPINGVDSVRWDLKMQPYAQYASTSEKRILKGVVIPANTNAQTSVKTALDTLFNHPNVGPFIGAQLIKRFTTSNPSPDYVRRVAEAFNNDGQGVRGDMRSVIRAIFLDTEVRSDAGLSSNTYGKVREPVMRLANWITTFQARAASGKFSIWNLEDQVWSIGQNPLRAPSVFNWYRPEYRPPGAIASAGLTAPEFQITHETTVTSYTNFILNAIERGFGDGNNTLKGNYTVELGLVDKPDELIERLNLHLTAGQLSGPTKTLIKDALTSINLVDNDARTRRLTVAIGLVMVSPDYLVQR